MVSLKLALGIEMLIVYGSPRSAIFFGVDDHCRAPIGWGTNGYRCDDSSFYVLPKRLFYGLFEMKWNGYRVVPGFGDGTFFQVYVGWGSRHGGKMVIISESSGGKFV